MRCFAVGVGLLPLLTLRALAQAPTPANFGQVSVNSGTPASQTLSFQFANLAAQPFFSLQYNTDFEVATSNCNGSWTSCTASVIFAPRYPGLRQDAVIAKDGNGNVLASAFVYGIGLGPQPAFSPGLFSTVSLTAPPDAIPNGVAVDASGDIYVSDLYNNVVVKVGGTTGHATVAAGTAAFLGAYSGDGGPATSARLHDPSGLAFDAAGNLYIVDQGNCAVRRVAKSTGVITTVAGNGLFGDTGDGGPAGAAELNQPTAIAIDAAGNIYVAEFYDRVRKINAATGVITRIAGNGTQGNSGDGGPATAAQLSTPSGLAVDAAGNLFISNQDGNTVRRVDAATGYITTVAGNGTAGYTGDGGLATAAELNSPRGITVDAAENIYIADNGNSAIRKVSGAGNAISTMAGNSVQGTSYIQNGYPATSGQLPTPSALAMDTAGDLYAASEWGLYTITAKTTSLMFPQTALGQLSTAQGLTLSNIGNQALSLTGLFTSGSFALEGWGTNVCSSSTTLAAGANCLVSVAFAPTRNGILAGSLVFTDNAFNQPGAQQQVSLLGPWAKAILSVSSVNVGTGAVGSPSGNQWITVSNPGNTPLTFASISVSGADAGDFTIDTSECATSIPAQTICSIDIFFTPMDVGTRTASLVFADNALNSPQVVSLSGNAVAPANVVISASNLVFPNQTLNTSSPPQTITVTNTGGERVQFNPLEPFGQDFSLIPEDNSCFYGLSPGATCTFTVTFTPTVPGLGTGGLYIVIQPNISNQTTTKTVAVSGYGISPPEFTGKPGDLGATGDFDGDGKLDYAVWRPANGTWYIIPSSRPQQVIVQQWGLAGDIPLSGDFDGDGKADFAVWRPSNGTWYIMTSSHPQRTIVQQWGVSGDVPVPGDFDGDGQTDFAVWRPSTGTWFVIPSGNPAAVYIRQWGLAGDRPVTGDFDGDGKTDYAVWRPSSGIWFIVPSAHPSAPYVKQWGSPTDIPVSGDFDGDSVTDVAVWRPANGSW